MLAALQARPRRKDDGGESSRRHGGERAPATDPAPKAACRLGALKVSEGDEERGARFSGDSAAVAEGTLKNQRQEGRQHLRSHRDTVLTRQWRCTSSASTARRCHRCRSGASSSSGAPRSPRRADQSVGHGGQFEVRQEKRLTGQPQGCQAEEGCRAPPRGDPPRSQESRVASLPQLPPQGKDHRLLRTMPREPQAASAPRC